jgi:PAS domain S-box-containing protein
MPIQTRLGSLLEALPDALVGVDRSGVIRFVNRRTESLFGYDREDLIGANLEMLVPESVREVHAAHRRSYATDPGIRSMGPGLRLAGRRRDGTEFPVDVALSPVSSGQRMLVIAAVREMSSHSMEQQEQQRLAAIVEHSDDAITSSTLDGIITSWNPAAEKLYGYSAEEIIGRSIRPVTPQDRADEITAILATVGAGRAVEHLVTIRVRKDGTLFPVSLTASPIRDADGEITEVSVIARDLTEQRKAIEADQRLAAIVESSDDAIMSSTLDGIVTSWNLASEELYGYAGNEIVGKSDWPLIPEDRADETRATFERIKAGERVGHCLSNRVRKDGTVIQISLTASPIRDADGRVVGVSTITRQLTKKEEAYELSRSMIEASLDSLVSISSEGEITDANQATVRLTGVPRDKLIGTSFSDYFTDPAKAEKIYQKVFTEGMAVDYPLTLRHRDGTLTEVLYNASAYHDAGGSVLGVFAAARDVTRQLQDQREIAGQQAREQNRLEELERFQRLTVGRELKMIELKKEIEYLRKSHGRHGGESDGGESDGQP